MTGRLDVLSRLAAPREPAGVSARERCEMCGTDVAREHSHVVDVTSRTLLCTCRPCTLLFDYPGAELRYQAVPDRYLSFPGVEVAASVWDDLQIPVGLTFLFRNSTLDRTVAFYPGPAGATESELPLGAWDAVLEAHPELDVGAPDVEALLLRAPEPEEGRDGVTVHLVPIDRCYELVGRLRQGWRGFDGGQQARAHLADFLAGVERRARPAPPRSST